MTPREAIAALQRQMEAAIVGQRDVIHQMIVGRSSVTCSVLRRWREDRT